MGAIRILLADDHTLVRAGIRSLLESLPDVEIVGESEDGREAVALVEKHSPDVAVLDIGMPGLNGIEAARRISATSTRTRIVMLSMHTEPTYVRQALEAGASGYLLKSAAASELPLAIRSVMRGETYLTPRISQEVVRGYLRPEEGSAPAPLAGLTGRQREILQLVAEGQSTKEIAHRLNVSIKTVETHRQRLMDRLDIHDVPGLVRFAIRAGIVSLEK